MKVSERTKTLEANGNRKTFVNFIFNDILHARTTTANMKLFHKLLGESGLNKDDLYDYVEANKEMIIEHLSMEDCSINSKLFSIFALFRNTLGKVTYAGCYEIRNKKTNEVYIGESIDLFRRFTNHTTDLYENRHHCVKLQEAFNLVRTMDNFTIKPIKVSPIVCADKMKVKEETLYMESAYYLMYKKEGNILYNTKHPYEALKNDDVSVGNNKVNCKNVLTLLCQDKYHILDKETLNFVLEDLKDIVEITTINKDKSKSKPKSIANEEIKKLKEQGNNFYRIMTIFKELSECELLPSHYSNKKVKKVLEDNNLIEIRQFDGFTRMFATEYALSEKLMYLDREYKENDGTVKCDYWVSEKGREFIFDVFRNYQNRSELEYVNLDETA